MSDNKKRVLMHPMSDARIALDQMIELCGESDPFSEINIIVQEDGDIYISQLKKTASFGSYFKCVRPKNEDQHD